VKEALWLDYSRKYELMVKERIVVAMRNSARQRRQYRRYFSDLAILTSEANFTDENLLGQKGLQAGNMQL
jgi:hypothetical protein